jgi:hypothetical protein
MNMKENDECKRCHHKFEGEISSKEYEKIKELVKREMDKKKF